ncbi:hypothetical protein [Mucilaginibacter sp. 44-25]|uniref:hypothetical protein n=1 Tax=Mucilaginibacter sp. 44-25 TaxID=1895794 RepID=UPI00095B11FE|nr:hypothetical protein [Mucilaginibacter sp. 44-25]OJW16820.1 MAG: hypothetical protein BGO48_10180 [Mucilaginibacter sp. 44-25]PMP65285.1 MAG: hypothetical protein C0191_03945 [Mucilaginibacter sp.]HEK19613.1 hypothetical protein [Bacteroidota bacterium]
MKFLRFNFCHPVKGNAHLTLLTKNAPKSMHFKFDSKETNLIEVPIDHCEDGRWKIELDWEYENKFFTHKKEFEIKAHRKIY